MGILFKKKHFSPCHFIKHNCRELNTKSCDDSQMPVIFSAFTQSQQWPVVKWTRAELSKVTVCLWGFYCQVAELSWFICHDAGVPRVGLLHENLSNVKSHQGSKSPFRALKWKHPAGESQTLRLVSPPAQSLPASLWLSWGLEGKRANWGLITT